MSGLLEESRIPLRLVPERPIVEALEETETARRVLEDAIRGWRERAPSWVRLDFAMQHQKQTEWCWAATSVSVSAYYDPRTSWTQCSMANAEKGLTTCCDDGSGDACNAPNRLDLPLARAGVLDHKQTGPLDYDDVRREIDAGRPLACRIGWSCGGGHFAVIDGYRSSGGEWVSIDDPWYSACDVEVSTLVEGTYQGRGTWTHTYFTRSRPVRPRGSDAREAAIVGGGEPR